MVFEGLFAFAHGMYLIIMYLYPLDIHPNISHVIVRCNHLTRSTKSWNHDTYKMHDTKDPGKKSKNNLGNKTARSCD